ncbi:hypothetical protein OR1_03422 [Geobacter sp. OR-1]|uniref:hypothetical protein n=1 Tax=Geobacter sp. OR-1 TaxID=1266765 RepID=UPI0005434980|nr:hypothetical protein [Geobacter sp. OR-1]GAM11113.1 hypothetical protein OR1_03422 [Geobacter sp. OR-1]
MKSVSIILLIVYLMLPAICFGHPCELPSMDSQHLSSVAADSGEIPVDHDTDSCETTCCCAMYVPLSAAIIITAAELTTRQLPYEPHLALPRLIDRIFVPPQNLS